MAREMLMNVAESDECRIAVIEDGRLEELYSERASLASHAGNIYKGKVENVEASIQAAFINFGGPKNGFLHISDLHPKYFGKKGDKVKENIGKRKALKERPLIQDCLRKGQEVVVQVIKEGIKTKGPTLTTYVSLPGKYLVMMPWMKHLGVSHKIADEEERVRLRKILDDSNLPKNVGFIIRTAGEGCLKRDIQNDLNYLKRLWTAIDKRIKKVSVGSELYQESDLVIRTLRDVFDSKISKVICDSEQVAKKIKDFLGIVMPRYKNRVSCYSGKTPLFHKYRLEDEIAKIQSRTVALKGGGTLVMEQTEALVAVDVNSGKFRKGQNAEQNAYKINITAAKEIARQLRLRDLGGLIICDFIDMRNARHRKDVEREFRAALKPDRARIRTLSISRFGIIEMTRQRIRPSLELSTYLACPHCSGSGVVKSQETVSIEVMRLMNFAMSKERVKRIELMVSPEIADYLQNQKRAVLAQMEQSSEKRVIIISQSNYTGEKRKVVCHDEHGKVVRI